MARVPNLHHLYDPLGDFLAHIWPKSAILGSYQSYLSNQKQVISLSQRSTKTICKVSLHLHQYFESWDLFTPVHINFGRKIHCKIVGLFHLCPKCPTYREGVQVLKLGKMTPVSPRHHPLPQGLRLSRGGQGHI